MTDTDRDSILDALGMDSNSNPTTSQGEVSCFEIFDLSSILSAFIFKRYQI